MSGRPWTAAEDADLRANYKCVPLPDLAARLNRTVGSLHNHARALGLHNTNRPITPADEERFRALYETGKTDAEIERETGFNRHRVGGWRAGQSLPVKPEAMARTRAHCVKAQCASLGMSSIGGGLRRYGFNKLAARYGLPEGLGPGHVRVALFLLRGPASKEQICRGVGRRFTRGLSRQSLKNGRNGSIPGDLIRAGLVTSRRVYADRKNWHAVYALTPLALALLSAGKDGA